MTINDLHLPVSRNTLLLGGGALLVALAAAVLLAPREAPGGASEAPREVILPDGQRLDMSQVPEARPLS